MQDAFERLRPYIERVLAGERIEYDVEVSHDRAVPPSTFTKRTRHGWSVGP